MNSPKKIIVIRSDETLLSIYNRYPSYFDYDCGKTSKKFLCDNKKCLPCYKRSFASIEFSKFWSKKNNCSPRQFLKSSSKYLFLFDCPCGHELENTLLKITSGNLCKYCRGQSLCENEDCIICFNKSFASHELVKYWSDKNEKRPRDMRKSSRKPVLFNCNICGHEFYIRLYNIKSGHWCPFCVHQKLCEDEDCDFCFKCSFASHPKSIYWSNKNKITPREIFLNNKVLHLFDCDTCGHEIEMSPNTINMGNWCSYCANQKLCRDETCEMCYHKSLASSDKIKYWIDPISPRTVFKNSRTEVYRLMCEYGHYFSMLPVLITRGCWCPHCKTKTESKLFDFLSSKYEVKRQAKFDWCKNEKTGRLLPFDFYIPSLNIIIELDGPQHFVQISNWKSPEDTRKFDIFKMKQCLKYNISLIRLPQEDVWNDTYNWMEKISDSIVKCNKPQIVYISEGNEYNDHKSNMGIRIITISKKLNSLNSNN